MGTRVVCRCAGMHTINRRGAWLTAANLITWPSYTASAAVRPMRSAPRAQHVHTRCFVWLSGGPVSRRQGADKPREGLQGTVAAARHARCDSR